MAPRESQPRPLYRAEDFSVDESLGYLIKRARGVLAAAVEREIADHDVTYEQWGTLAMILTGRGATAASLARSVDCDTGSMTRMLDRLEAKELIRRTPSSDDRRRVDIELTSLGKRRAERLVAAIVSVLNRHLAGFSPAELETFKDFLRRLIANHDASERP